MRVPHQGSEKLVAGLLSGRTSASMLSTFVLGCSSPMQVSADCKAPLSTERFGRRWAVVATEIKYSKLYFVAILINRGTTYFYLSFLTK